MPADAPYTLETVVPLPLPVLLPIAGERGVEARFPVHRIYCVGQNYRAHALEMGAKPERAEPIFFQKPADAAWPASSNPGSYAKLDFPRATQELHYEVELVIALKAGGVALSLAAARSAIYGYAVGIDLTRRDLQRAAKQAGEPWDMAKGFDMSAPIGPILPVATGGHIETGTICLTLDGQLRQKADLGEMIWKVPDLLARLSHYVELQPGDLIFTGTPAGVGPLKRGDQLAASIDGLSPLYLEIV